jgi:hypothetical protein
MEVVGLASGVVSLVDNIQKTLSVIQHVYDLPTRKPDRKMLELLTTASLARSSLSLLETQFRLLTTSPALAYTPTYSTTTYDDIFTTSRATIAMVIVAKDRLGRAMTAAAKSDRNKSKLKLRAHLEVDVEDQKDVLHELLQTELIPLIQRHEALIALRHVKMDLSALGFYTLTTIGTVLPPRKI